MQRTRPLRVKFILPALTEATSPYWRPIKYSLFPPLGLATLAAYLGPDDEAVIVDEHVEPLTDRRRAGPRRHPGLHHQRLPRVSHRRPLPRQGVFVALGGLHVTSLPDEAAPHADAIFLGPGEQTFPQFLDDFRARPAAAVYRSTVGAHARTRPADPPRPDQPPPLSRAELDRRHARLPAALRLLLQGRVLRGRPIVLHAARRRGARRDRAAARAASVLPRRPSARQSALRRARCSTACAAWTACSRARRPWTRSCAAT